MGIIVASGLRLAYIDESGTEGEEGWFILTAFIIESDIWKGYNQLWMGVPSDVKEEVDSLKELRHPTENLDPDQRHQASMKIYDIIDDLGYRAISILVHQPQATNFCKVEEIYNTAFTYLIERFEYLLTEFDEHGVIFVDERDDKSPLHLQERHYKLKREGTFYADFERTIGAAAPLRDDESIPMSLSDWVGSAIRNCYIRDRPQYYEKIHNNMQRHPRSKKVLGSGIKVVPDDCVNELKAHPDSITF